jgi:hypothetical protein
VTESVLAPGEIGVYRLRFRVPADTPDGHQEVVVRMGDAASNPQRLPVGTILMHVSAASGRASPAASESLVTAHICGPSPVGASAEGNPRNPPTVLNGVTVRIRDSAGREQPAPIYYVSPRQVNYVVPAGTGSEASVGGVGGGFRDSPARDCRAP